MEWRADSSLASRILEDIGKELDIGQEQYLANLPHTSELIYCLTRSYYNRLDPLPANQQETLLFSLGIGLEKVLLRPHRKGEAGEHEGIYWSADWLDYTEGLGELKTSRLSAKKGPEELPATWIKQILSYLKATGHREISLAVLHVMGNYSPPFPVLQAWRGKASDIEVQANWNWMQERKRVYLDHIERKEPPKQFRFNEDWECSNCRYLIVCQAKESIERIRSEDAIG